MRSSNRTPGIIAINSLTQYEVAEFPISRELHLIFMLFA